MENMEKVPPIKNKAANTPIKLKGSDAIIMNGCVKDSSSDANNIYVRQIAIIKAKPRR